MDGEMMHRVHALGAQVKKPTSHECLGWNPLHNRDYPEAYDQ
jgi:hypothetical protein